MSSQTIDKLTPKVSLKVQPPKLPKTAQQLAKSAGELAPSERGEPAAGDVTTTETPNGQALEGGSSAGAASAAVSESGATFVWLWIVLAVVVVLGALGGLWWWRRKRKQQSPVAMKATPKNEFDALGDWNAFRAKLAPNMKRVLDDFQPVIVLGDVASEKDRVIEQLTGVEDSLRLHSSSAVFRGKTLHVFLGDCTLLVAPTHEFCRLPTSVSDPGWQGVLRRVGRIRPPRVVACVSSAAVDLGGTPELTDWMGMLRQHVALVAAVRGENVDVHAVMAEPPTAGRAGAKATSTEVLFDLVRELNAHEASYEAQRVELSQLGTGRSEEERNAAGQAWAEGVLWSYYRGWTKLFTRKGQNAENTLALVRLFERLPVLSSGLGTALAELFADTTKSDAPKGVRKDLVLVPSVGDRLQGTLSAFDPPEYDKEGVPWYPSARLRHRLWVTSGAALCATLLYTAFHFDKLQWQRAATASQTYDAPDEAADFRVVEDYFKHRLHAADMWLPDFFDRDLPRFLVVDKMRSYLEKRMTNPPVPEEATPEAQLQLVTLFVTGSPSDCDIPEGGATYAEFRRLTDVISENIEQWSLLTGLDHREISGYLDMACPQDGSAVLDGVVMQCGSAGSGAQGGGEACEWDDVPDAADFVAVLSSLSGKCSLRSKEKEAIRRANDIQREIGVIGREHGAAKLVLDTVEKINHETMRALARMFSPHRERLSAISDLATEDEDMRLLIADVRPFLETPMDGRASDVGGCAGRLCSLRGFNEALEAIVTVPTRNGVRSIQLGGQTYVVDRRPVRDSLEAAAFERLVSSFGQRATRTEGIFFKTGQFRNDYRWYMGESPVGLRVITRVSQEYTLRGFREFVKPELDTTAQYASALSCVASQEEVASEPSGAPAADDLRQLIEAQLGSYAAQYLREWRRVYDSFQIDDKLSAVALARVLDALNRPNSPQLEMLRTVVAQTNLGLEEDFAFSEPLSPIAAAFSELAPVVEDAAFEEYRGLLQELLDVVSAVEIPEATPAEPPVDAATAREQFGARLPAFGRASWAELQDPTTSLTLRAKAWLKEGGVGEKLQRPFLAPFRAAANMGHNQLRSEVGKWWRPIGKRFHDEVLSRFPFARDAGVEVEVESLTRWLHPTEGKLSLEVVPIMDALRACGACRQDLDAEVYERARAIQTALFGDNGEPRTLMLSIEPMPFLPQALAPKKASLQVNDARYDYFNTAPSPFEVPFAWGKHHSVALEVELARDPGSEGATGDRLTARVLREDASPWALLRLLARGANGSGELSSAETGTFHFSLAAADPRKPVKVSYKVCAWARRCDGLFDEVLQW